MDWAALGLGAPADPDAPDPLDAHVLVGAALLPGLTGYTLESTPVANEPIVLQVIGGLALKSAIDLSPDRLETLVDFDLLASFSAGSYSETRRSADDAAKVRELGLTGWPWLDFLLLNAMSPEKKDEYLALVKGEYAPASSVTEVDWAGWVDSYEGYVED